MNHNICNACVRGKPVYLPDSQDLVNLFRRGTKEHTCMKSMLHAILHVFFYIYHDNIA